MGYTLTGEPELWCCAERRGPVQAWLTQRQAHTCTPCLPQQASPQRSRAQSSDKGIFAGVSATWPASQPSPPCAPWPTSVSSPHRASASSRPPRVWPSPSACAPASCRHPPRHKRLPRCCNCPPSCYPSSCPASTLAPSPVSPNLPLAVARRAHSAAAGTRHWAGGDGAAAARQGTLPRRRLFPACWGYFVGGVPAEARPSRRSDASSSPRSGINTQHLRRQRRSAAHLRHRVCRQPYHGARLGGPRCRPFCSCSPRNQPSHAGAVDAGQAHRQCGHQRLALPCAWCRGRGLLVGPRRLWLARAEQNRVAEPRRMHRGRVELEELSSRRGWSALYLGEGELI